MTLKRIAQKIGTFAFEAFLATGLAIAYLSLAYGWALQTGLPYYFFAAVIPAAMAGLWVYLKRKKIHKFLMTDPWETD